METPILDRALRPYRPGEPGLSRRAADFLTTGETLWTYPQQLSLPSLSAEQEQALSQPAPPQLRRLISFYARFFRKRPKLAERLGLPPETLPALERGELTLSRLLQLCEALSQAAADSQLALGEAMGSCNEAVEQTAERVAKAAPSRGEAAKVRSLFSDASRQRDLAESREAGRAGRLAAKKAPLLERADKARRGTKVLQAGAALRKASRRGDREQE